MMKLFRLMRCRSELWSNPCTATGAQAGRKGGCEAPLKTKNAYRNISIASDSVEVLKSKSPEDSKPDDYVSSSPTGSPISPDNVLHMPHRVLKRTGPPKVRFHDLRHTFLALQWMSPLPGMLDHYSAGFTLDTYECVK